jgi:osmotically-inducible protein OsmY
LAGNPEYQLPNVQVVTLKGVPRLSGVVTSEDQRRWAGDTALKVEGVLAVVNLITVTK